MPKIKRHLCFQQNNNLLVYEDSNHWCNKLSSKIPFMTVEDF